MKKFTKSGHLQGNTTVSFHSTPFLHSPIPMDTLGYITDLNALSAGWNLELVIQTDAIAPSSLEMVISDSTTNSGALADIVSLINSHPDNQNYIVASILGGSLLLKTTSSGDGAFIRIMPSTGAFPSSAVYFGFAEYPHSQSTVYAGDIKGSSTDTLGQQNPPGTKFIANGEDRTSESYNRALAATAANMDANESMLARKLAVQVTLGLAVDQFNLSDQNDRFIVDPVTNRVKAINLSSAVADNFSTLLQSRVLVGTLNSNSTLRQIREIFQITDHEGKEISSNGYPVRVSGLTTGSAAGSPPAGPFTLESQPNAGSAPATIVGGGGNILGVDIRRNAGTQSIPITGYFDKYTIECATATFITGNVAKGDVLTISGASATAYSNNGSYIVENVISETVIEIKPYHYSDIAYLETTSTGGTVSVSTGGMWLKDVVLWLTEPMQLPLNHNVYVSVPLEEVTGDLPEDALIKQDLIEVPWWVVSKISSSNLDTAYVGPATSRKAAGYYIDADTKAVEIRNDVHSTTKDVPTSLRTITNVDIFSGNVVQIAQGSTDFFSDADLGRYLRFNTSVNTSPPHDGRLLNGELVVIVQLLDSKTVKVRKISRQTADLPPTANIGQVDVIEEDARHLLTGAMNHVVETSSNQNLSTVGGYNTIIDSDPKENDRPDAYYTSVELERIAIVHPTASPSVSIVKLLPDSGTQLQAMDVDGKYMSQAYPLYGATPPTTLENISQSELESFNTPGLLLRIFNGPNAGFYFVNVIQDAMDPIVRVSSLKGDTVTLDMTIDEQWGSFYAVAQGSRAYGINSSLVGDPTSQLHVTGTDQRGPHNTEKANNTGISVTWKGPGAGISVYSNLNTFDASSAGMGSKGANVKSFAGPGSDGITTTVHGIRGFDTANLPSQATVNINQAQGLGGRGIYGKSTTYHLDIKNRADYAIFKGNSSFFVYYAAAGSFEGTSPDPALLVSAFKESNVSPHERPDTIYMKNVSSATAVIVNQNYVRRDENGLQQEFGKTGNALSIYGNIFSCANITQPKKQPNLIYTESIGSFVSVYPSEPKGIKNISDKDPATAQPYPVLGSPGIIGRIFSTSETFKPLIVHTIAEGIEVFNTTCDLVVTLKPNRVFPTDSNRYNPFLHVQNIQDLVGAFLFFAKYAPEWDVNGDHEKLFDYITLITNNHVGQLPFHMGNDRFVEGNNLAFKIVAVRESNVTDPLEVCWHLALSIDEPYYTGNVNNPGATVSALNLPDALSGAPASCIIYRKRFKGGLDVTSWIRLGSPFKATAESAFNEPAAIHHLPAGASGNSFVKTIWAAQSFLQVYAWKKDILINGDPHEGDYSFQGKYNVHKLPLLTSHPLPNYGSVEPMVTGANPQRVQNTLDLGDDFFDNDGPKPGRNRLPKALTPTTYPLSTGTGIKRDFTAGTSPCFLADSSLSSDSHIQGPLGTVARNIDDSTITAEHQSGITTEGSIGIRRSATRRRVSFQNHDVFLNEKTKRYSKTGEVTSTLTNSQSFVTSGVCGNFGLAWDDINFEFGNPDLEDRFSKNFRTGFVTQQLTELKTVHGHVIKKRAFCGGGHKLVLGTNYAKTEVIKQDNIEFDVNGLPLFPYYRTTHSLFVKVGANHIDNTNGIRIILSVANSHPTEQKTIRARLCREVDSSDGVLPELISSQSTTQLHSNGSGGLQALDHRSYQTVEFVFAKHEVEAMFSVDSENGRAGREIHRTREDQSLYVELRFTTEGALHIHPGLSGLSESRKERLGAAVGWMPVSTGSTFLGQTGPTGNRGEIELRETPTFDWSYNLNMYPDVFFINSVSVVADHDQALVTTGMDIQGAARARSLRLLSSVTGHQVISPANVELLQNTEYGNKRGSGRLYYARDRAVQDSGSHFEMYSVLGENSRNLEGNSVGLLPMWFASQAGRSSSMGDDFHHLMKTTQTEFMRVLEPGVAYNYAQSIEENSSRFLNTINLGDVQATPNYSYILAWNDDTSIPNSEMQNNPYPTGELWQYDPGVLDIYSATTVDGKHDYKGQHSFARMAMFASVQFKGLRYMVHGWKLWNIGAFNERYNEVLGIDANFTDNWALLYKGAFCYTRFYKPKFDLGSIFKKGVHSAAIHAHTPYFDPLFYWEFCMTGIDFGRVLEREGGVMNKGILYTDSIFSGGNIFNKFNIGSYRRGETGAQGGPGHATFLSDEPSWSVHTSDGTSYDGDDIFDDSQYTSLSRSKCLPDAFNPCGRTGFLVPIDPPHGSLLTGLELNISFRLMTQRNSYQEDGNNVSDIARGTLDFAQGSIRYDYGVYFDYPEGKNGVVDPVDMTGETMRGRDGWREKEGYLLRVWRHSPFAQGLGLGDAGSHMNEDRGIDAFSADMLEMEGHATLIFEKVVTLREGSVEDGAISSSDYEKAVDGTKQEISELMSRLRIKFNPDSELRTNLLLVDRANYSYFVTIEFYTGVRKLIGKDGSDLNFTIPGLFYNSDVNTETANHFPYMWTPAFPGTRPQGMSSIWGNDPATRWEGYWEPHPHYAGFESRYHNSIHVGHPLNISYGGFDGEGGSPYAFKKTTTQFTPDNSDFDSEFRPSTQTSSSITTHAINYFELLQNGAIAPTISTSRGYADTYKSNSLMDNFHIVALNTHNAFAGTEKMAAINNFNNHTSGNEGFEDYDPNGQGLNSAMSVLLNQRTHVHDSTVWYPVIKFRGMRITYQTDRPGHGGWGG